MPKSPTIPPSHWQLQASEVASEIRRSYIQYGEPILLTGFNAKLVGMSGTESLADSASALVKQGNLNDNSWGLV